MRGWMMVAAAAGLLAACGGDQPAGEAVAGGGELLEGSANDAMLPLATVTSEPPLEPEQPPARDGGRTAAEPATDSAAAADTPDPASTATAAAETSTD